MFIPHVILCRNCFHLVILCNYSKENDYLRAVRKACRRSGISLDVYGLGVGEPGKPPKDFVGFRLDRPAGEIIYWHVNDVQATLDRLLSMGATLREGIRDRGRGFITTSVIDPFGNVWASCTTRTTSTSLPDSGWFQRP